MGYGAELKVENLFTGDFYKNYCTALLLLILIVLMMGFSLAGNETLARNGYSFISEVHAYERGLQSNSGLLLAPWFLSMTEKNTLPFIKR